MYHEIAIQYDSHFIYKITLKNKFSVKKKPIHIFQKVCFK